MKKVTFKGTGQLNGPVIIDKTIELEDKEASRLSGANRNDVKLAMLNIYYPGVKIDPTKIGVEIIPIKKESNKEKIKSDISTGVAIGAVAASIFKKSEKNEEKKSNKAEIKSTRVKKEIDEKKANNSQSSFKKLIIDTGTSIIDDFKQSSFAKKEKERFYQQKKDEIFVLPIPTSQSEIIQQIDFLLLCINNESWDNGNDGEFKNNYTDLCFEKYKQLLKSLTKENSNFPFYKKKLNKLRIKRFIKKHL